MKTWNERVSDGDVCQHCAELEEQLSAMTAAKDKALDVLKQQHESVNDSLADEGVDHMLSMCPVCKLIAELEDVNP